MTKEKKHESDVTLEVINEIFLEDTPEYHHIKELAEKDLGKELMERIEKFLEHKDEPAVEEIKKVIFEDASKVSDTNINDIVDAFVRIRSGESMDNVDKKSINDILILFNQWVAIGKGQQEASFPKDLFNDSILEKKKDKFLDLEEQVLALRQPASEDLYKMHAPTPNFSPREIYSPQGQGSQLYDTNQPSDFVCCPDHNSEGYQSKTIYKSHGGKLNFS